MGYTLVAVTVGIVAGLVAGGRPSNAAGQALRWWPALTVGIVAQWVPELLGIGERVAFPAVLASYAALAAFAVANLHLVGMSVVTTGLALNLVVIAANGGMPVRASAVVAAGIAETPAEVRALDFGSKRHLEGADDRLVVLGDIVPVPLLREVLSFGDLVLAVGIADVVFRLLRPLRPVRHVIDPIRGPAATGHAGAAPVDGPALVDVVSR